MKPPVDLMASDQLLFDLGDGAQADRLTRFQAALENSWQIQPPVYARLGWHIGEHPSWTFYFVLVRDGKTSLIGVQDTPQLSALMIEHGLTGADIVFDQQR